MPHTRRFLAFALALAALVGAARAQPIGTAPFQPLQPLAHWVGGEWVGEFDGPGGRKLKVVRSYQWSFDNRLLVGRSWNETDGRRVQSRETVYYWNPESRRIEFHDHLDQAGGHGHGYIELRDGQIYMNVHVVGSRVHPDWRAWIKESGDDQEIRVDTLRDDKWGTLGTYKYRHVR